MKTVNEVSKMAGVSVRTLQYYDNIGLLKPAKYTEAGYRLYDEESLARLQQILLFKELEFPLDEIKRIIDAPGFDQKKALAQQIELLKLKKEHFENLIDFAERIKSGGTENMDFTAFDKKKIEEYSERATKEWGDTAEYKEYEGKAKGRTDSEQMNIAEGLMAIFEEFGKIKNADPTCQEAQALAGKLQDYITENYYHCSDEILASLGKMYAAGGEFTENIDAAGGTGTAKFADAAIEIYCKNR